MGLLERSRVLLPDGDIGHTLLALRISDCWLSIGDPKRSDDALKRAQRELRGETRSRLTLKIQREHLALRFGLRPVDVIRAKAQETEGFLSEDAADDINWCRVHRLNTLLLRVFRSPPFKSLPTERAAADG